MPLQSNPINQCITRHDHTARSNSDAPKRLSLPRYSSKVASQRGRAFYSAHSVSEGEVGYVNAGCAGGNTALEKEQLLTNRWDGRTREAGSVRYGRSHFGGGITGCVVASMMLYSLTPTLLLIELIWIEVRKPGDEPYFAARITASQHWIFIHIYI